MSLLDEIIAQKKTHIAQRKEERPWDVLAAYDVLPKRGFKKAVQARVGAQEAALIAELKKASPSQGVLCELFDIDALARAYDEGGATCLSVLTDQPYFQGRDDYIAQVKQTVDLPVLRKDFIIDPYQVLESHCLGADCILLILAILEDDLARELETQALSYGLDVLIEVHDRQELDRALVMQSQFIGINNRNLATLEVDLAMAETLAKLVPTGYTVVAESGISGYDDIRRLQDAGVFAYLVGHHLIQQEDVALATRQLLNGVG
jgi:indole-3-glycerol phosphate synthase